MANARLSRSLCAVVGECIASYGSHPTLNALFKSAGLPGEPPQLSHHLKWKTWLFEAGNKPEVDSLSVLGNIIEEFMDIGPGGDGEMEEEWKMKRNKILQSLEENGFRYYRGGRVLPKNVEIEQLPPSENLTHTNSPTAGKPSKIEELLEILIRGLPRSMHPLTYRRKGAQPLSFKSEYDIQDLLHSLLRPWVADIRPEEFTPSYAGSSTRMDFLLPRHSLVLELKYIRDRSHAKTVGSELIIDIEHYRKHPQCEALWCVIYDPENLIPNKEGLIQDLSGDKGTVSSKLNVKVFVISI